MRILNVLPYWYPHSGGVISVAYNLSLHLISTGNDVSFLVPAAKEIDRKGMTIYTVPQIVNILNMNPITFGLLPTIKKLEREFDIILLHSYIYELNSRISLYKWFRLIEKPIILYFHGGLDASMDPYIGWDIRLCKKIYDLTLGRLCFKYTDKIISVSKNDINLMKEKYKIEENKIKYIPNGIDTSQFYKKHHEGLKIIFIGRLVRWKGVIFFEHILRSIPSDVEFIVIGDGPMKDFADKLSKKYKNLKLLGNISHEGVIEALSTSDIFILPTLTEASPISYIEASAAGLPSIVFSVGELPNMMPDNCGYKIAPYNIEDFCDKLIYLLDNKTLRDEFGKNAKYNVEMNFNIIKIALELESYLYNARNNL